MIDLRKDKRQYFWIDKTTLEAVPRKEIKDIWAELFNMIISQDDLNIIDEKRVKITREEYKEFRKMNEEQKKLFIECY